MKRAIPVVVSIAALLSACATGNLRERAENACGGMGINTATINYGDSVIDVVPPILNLIRGAEMRIRLRPVRPDMPEKPTADLLVTVEGKPKLLADDPDNSWIEERSTTYNDSDGGFMESICVPRDVQTPVDYKYLVRVENVGMLDPRARVN